MPREGHLSRQPRAILSANAYQSLVCFYPIRSTTDNRNAKPSEEPFRVNDFSSSVAPMNFLLKPEGLRCVRSPSSSSNGPTALLRPWLGGTACERSGVGASQGQCRFRPLSLRP